MIILDWIMRKINALMRDKGHSITYTVPRDILSQLAYNHFLTSGVINLETHYAESAQAHHRTGGDVEINMTVTNINITCTTNRASFTRTFVFVEYIQEL